MSQAPSMLQQVLYPPERIMEARPINLVANTPIILTEMTNIATAKIPWLVRLVRLAQEQRADTDVTIEGLGAARRHEWTVDTDALSGIDDETLWDAYFDDNLIIRYLSTANVTNYRSRALFEVMNYTIAQKIALGIPDEAMTQDERDISAKWQLRKKVLYGELPKYDPESYMAYPAGPLLYQVTDSYVGNVAAGADGEQTIVELPIEPGKKAIVRYIYANRPVANVGDLQIRIYRERALDYTLYPHCLVNFPTVTQPAGWLPGLWIPAINHLRVTVFSGTGHAGVIATAKVDVRKMTIWDKIAWGLLKNPRYTSDDDILLVKDMELEEKSKAGIYEPFTWR